ncbi:MAG: right-handed parallel beta-helix repeat-containing protein [Kiritimatiellae bacterium]|nr:right-handed parallel beta-helix repeat-containing protein [Kiritimatiellia bacterium]
MRHAGRFVSGAVALLFGAASLPPAAWADGVVRYVAPDGDDANPGTEQKPWKTLSAAVKASTRPGPGDTVLIKAGTYVETPFWKIHVHGSAEKPATFKAYGDGDVRVTSSTVLPADGWQHVRDAIYRAELDGRVMAVFQNEFPLVFPGNDEHPVTAVDEMYPNSFFLSGTTLYVWLADGSDPKESVLRVAPSHVVVVDKSHYVVLDGLTLEYGFVGIKENRASTGLTVRNCTLRSLTSHGIQPTPAECVIEDCRFEKIGSTRTQCGIKSVYTRGLIVRHNVFEAIAGPAVHQRGDTEPPPPGVEICGNIFRRPRPYTDGASHSGYAEDLMLWGRSQKTRVYNNVFCGGGKRPAIALLESGNRVWNNTFVESSVAVGFGPKSKENEVVNNIFLDAGETFFEWPAGATPQTVDWNLYFSRTGAPRWQRAGATYTRFSDYQNADGGERNSRYADPRLAEGAEARPQPGSPAIDTGMRLEEVTVDCDGAARPQGPAYDLGAYEFRPSSN